MLFFILFLVVPFIEISLFIIVGDEIGVMATLSLCVLTAALGAVLLRHQGLVALFSARSAWREGHLPLHELFDGFCLSLAAVLLMTPGFFTDSLGFALLFPPVRTWIRRELVRRFDPDVAFYEETHFTDSGAIEGDFRRLDREDTDKP